MTNAPLVWTGLAPAKINLRLAVLGRERDGYHRLETVFQRLELADRIELTVGGETPVEDGSVRLEVSGVAEGELGPDSRNLAVRAARRFLMALDDRIGVRQARSLASGVAIRLEKQIPSGAGLGGGSSDAAAVLQGLNELAGEPLDREELMRLGGGLGSDVPFFLSGASRALGRGRGDRIVPQPPLPTRPVLLAVPDARVSTAWAYGVLAAARVAEETPPLAIDARPLDCEPPPSSGASIEGWNEVAAAAHNDFETSLFPVRPDLARLKRLLVEAGACPALLSGSGAVVFGVFGDTSAMEQAVGGVRAVDGAVRLLRTRTDDA